MCLHLDHYDYHYYYYRVGKLKTFLKQVGKKIEFLTKRIENLLN